MKLSDEQKTAVNHIGHLSLASCPGSGKTRTIVAKLLHCLETVRGTSRRIGCITYTNAAVHEIENRLRCLGSKDDDTYIEISTIHAFCLTHILRPFHHRLTEFANGFEVFSPDDPEWGTLIRHLLKKYTLNARLADSFESIERQPDGSVRYSTDLPAAAVEEFLAFCDNNRRVAFSDIVYHAHRLAKADQSIPRGIASRFGWLLIDEFQDTTATQVDLFRMVASFERTLFFLVGDPNQSIMSFAGGHPQLMEEFASHLQARRDVSLTGNYRCSSLIVDHAERLCPCRPRMRAEGNDRNFHAQPEHIHTQSSTEALFEHFLPAVESLGIPLGEAAVLAPWWTTLYQLARQLRVRGVPMIGPGSRPYRRSHEFSRFAEQACSYIEEPTTEAIQATQKELFLLIANLCGTADWTVYSYAGRKVLFRILYSLREYAKVSEAASTWLIAAATEASSILCQSELIPIDKRDVLLQSAHGMIDDMTRNGVDVGNLSITDLGIFARPKSCLNLITLHGSKGREFDAVAIIDLHEGRLPNFRAATAAEFAEARRLMYVGVTRARKLLMYCTDSSDSRNQPSRYLGADGLGLF